MSLAIAVPSHVFAQKEMEAFDSLPPEVRDVLRYSPVAPPTAQEVALRYRLANRQVQMQYGPNYYVDPTSFADWLSQQLRALCQR